MEKVFLYKKKEITTPKNTAVIGGDSAVLNYQTLKNEVRMTECGVAGANTYLTGGHKLIRNNATVATAQAPIR